MKKYKENSAIIVVLAACVLFMFSGGIRTNFGIIVQTLADRTGVSYADVSFAIAVGQLVYGLSQPFFGIIALKRSNGFVLSLGTLLMASGLLLTAQVHSTPGLVITLGLLFCSGTGAACFGIIMAAITPVLGRRRASAVSGILNASSGIGSSLLSPIMQTIQASAGVGTLLMVLSVPALLLFPVCIWITRVSGSFSEDETHEKQDISGRLMQALRDPAYHRLMIGFGTCGFHMCIIHTHIFSQIVSYGIKESTASLAYTVFGLTSMAGAVLCGFVCQRLPMKNVLCALYGTRAAIVAVFILLLPKTIIPVFLFIIVLGMTGDATVTPTSEIISRRFGPESLGLLFGITYVCHQTGAFISSWLGGIFITNSGNYQAIWLIDIALCTIASLASLSIKGV